ncbi:MAG: type VI secretion system baseplate subunit TssG [Pirellulales bacterium]
MEARTENANERIERLQQQAECYSFFQALRELEAVDEQRPRIGSAHSPSAEWFRIRQLPELTFAPGTIRRIGPSAAGRLEVDQRFFGLLGVSGPMPSHLTEIVRNRSRHAHDPALQAFLDIFHHRMGVLFYRAWSSARPAVQRDRPREDRFAALVAALCGVGLKNAGRRDRWPDETKWYFAGRMGALRRNREGMAAVVESIVGAPTKVRPFVLRKLPLPESETTRIGGSSSSPSRRTPLSSARGDSNGGHATGSGILGRGAVLGSRVADRQGLFEVQVGPMSLQTFQNYMPGSRKRRTLQAAIQNYAPIGTEARVRLIVRGTDVPGITLGARGSLGRDAWMRPAGKELDDRDDFTFSAGGMTADPAYST